MGWAGCGWADWWMLVSIAEAEKKPKASPIDGRNFIICFFDTKTSVPFRESNRFFGIILCSLVHVDFGEYNTIFLVCVCVCMELIAVHTYAWAGALNGKSVCFTHKTKQMKCVCECKYINLLFSCYFFLLSWRALFNKSGKVNETMNAAENCKLNVVFRFHFVLNFQSMYGALVVPCAGKFGY